MKMVEENGEVRVNSDYVPKSLNWKWNSEGNVWELVTQTEKSDEEKDDPATGIAEPSGDGNR